MLLRWMFAYNLELCKEKNDKLSSFSFHNIVNVFQPPAKVLNAIHDFQFDYQCILNDAILSFLKRYGFSFFFSNHRCFELLKRSTVHDGLSLDIFSEPHFSSLSARVLFGRTVKTQKFFHIENFSAVECLLSIWKCYFLLIQIVDIYVFRFITD